MVSSSRAMRCFGQLGAAALFAQFAALGRQRGAGVIAGLGEVAHLLRRGGELDPDLEAAACRRPPHCSRSRDETTRYIALCQSDIA
jgi:hypothetical protein